MNRGFVFFTSVAKFRTRHVLLSAVCGKGRTFEPALGTAAVRAELSGVQHQAEGGAVLFDHPDAAVWQKLQDVPAHPALPGAGRDGYH